MNAEQYWERVIKILREDINEVTFKAFIAPIIPVRYTDEYFIVKLSIEAGIYRDMLKKYIKKINTALTRVFERPMTLIYEDEIDKDDNVTLQKERIESARKEKGLNPEYSFENYVVGNSNNTAYAAAVAIADNPGGDDMYNPFFIYGGVGLGKTHLMHAIGNYFMDNNPNAKVLYVTCEKFTNEFIAAISSRTTMEFKDKYRELDLLLIDDVQFLSGKTETQEEFFHTFNSLTDAKKQIVMCSDRKPSEIKTLADRLVGRMSSGIMFDIKAPDFETRTAILEKKAEKKHIKVDSKILQYIALKITSNIRILEGAFNNIVLYSGLNNRIIDLELVDEVLNEYINSNKEKLSVKYIQETVADFYRVSIDELLSKRRTKPLTTYRHIAMYLCRKHLEESLEEIGEKFGGRDHSTVMNGCDKITRLIDTNEERASEIKIIEKRLMGN